MVPFNIVSSWSNMIRNGWCLMTDAWQLFVSALKCSVFLSCNRRTAQQRQAQSNKDRHSVAQTGTAKLRQVKRKKDRHRPFYPRLVTKHLTVMHLSWKTTASWAVNVSLCLSLLRRASPCWAVPVFFALCLYLLRCACPRWSLLVPLLFRNRILTDSTL